MPAHFLFSIREDALAKLDLFEDRLPDLWQNLLRIEHLDYAAAREAIEQPDRSAGTSARRLRDRDDDASSAGLVDAVLVRGRRAREPCIADKAGRGRDRAAGETDSGRPQISSKAPYLQLVMTRLCGGGAPAAARRALRVATLRRLGGAEQHRPPPLRTSVMRSLASPPALRRALEDFSSTSSRPPERRSRSRRRRSRSGRSRRESKVASVLDDARRLLGVETGDAVDGRVTAEREPAVSATGEQQRGRPRVHARRTQDSDRSHGRHGSPLGRPKREVGQGVRSAREASQLGRHEPYRWEGCHQWKHRRASLACDTIRSVGIPFGTKKELIYAGISPDGRMLLTVSAGDTRLWDVHSHHSTGLAGRRAPSPAATSTSHWPLRARRPMRTGSLSRRGVADFAVDGRLALCGQAGSAGVRPAW